MNDPHLNNLLKWGIQNSEASRNDPSATAQQPPVAIDYEALRSVFSGEKMLSVKEHIENMIKIVEDEEAPLGTRALAFEEIENQILNLDNANDMANSELWTRVVKQLENDEASLRAWAAWVCSTAVQNNTKTQEKLLTGGTLPILVRMATSDSDREVRKKAINALSSSVRNFQPALDATLSIMPANFKPQEQLDANDMESVDILINKLRASL